MNWKVGDIVKAEATREGRSLRSVTFRIVDVTPVFISATPAMTEEQRRSASTFIEKMGKQMGMDTSLNKVLYFFDPATGNQVAPFGPLGITFRISHLIN